MTTTIPQQDLTITYTSTKEDAQLMLAVLNGPMATRAMDGIDLLLGYESPPTFEQFDADHPHGSDGARAVSAVLALNETIGTFVKQGLLDRGLVYDMFWIAGIWQPIAMHYRQTSGVPEMYENFEALAKGQTS